MFGLKLWTMLTVLCAIVGLLNAAAVIAGEEEVEEEGSLICLSIYFFIRSVSLILLLMHSEFLFSYMDFLFLINNLGQVIHQFNFIHGIIFSLNVCR